MTQRLTNYFFTSPKSPTDFRRTLIKRFAQRLNISQKVIHRIRVDLN